VGKSDGKRQLKRPRPRWDDNKMDFRELGWGGMDWIHWLRIGTSGGLM
jgi:hypothetical protein